MPAWVPPSWQWPMAFTTKLVGEVGAVSSSLACLPPRGGCCSSRLFKGRFVQLFLLLCKSSGRLSRAAEQAAAPVRLELPILSWHQPAVTPGASSCRRFPRQLTPAHSTLLVRQCGDAGLGCSLQLWLPDSKCASLPRSALPRMQQTAEPLPAMHCRSGAVWSQAGDLGPGPEDACAGLDTGRRYF